MIDFNLIINLAGPVTTIFVFIYSFGKLNQKVVDLCRRIEKIEEKLYE